MSALAALAALCACMSALCALWAATSPEGLAFLRSLLARALLGAKAARRGGLASVFGDSALGGVAKRAADALHGILARGQKDRLRARDKGRCLDELPELIDVVALGMSAGISFDAALGIYCEKYDTMLARELADAKRSWDLGLTTRSEALHALARRLEVPAFSTFVDTATESLAFGAPLTRALGGQARAVRRARRAEVQERIEKAPIKMLVPTGTLILPAMLLAVLGPLLASLSELTG